MNYAWSESAGRYQPVAPVNRRFLGNEAFLISLGVDEESVTGYRDESGVSYLARLALLQPRSRARVNADAGSRFAGSRIAVSRLRPRLRPNVEKSE